MDAKIGSLEDKKLLSFKKNFFQELIHHLSHRSTIIAGIRKLEFNTIFYPFFGKICVFVKKWSKMAKKMVMVVTSSVSPWVFIVWRDLKCMLDLSSPISNFGKNFWSWATSSCPNHHFSVKNALKKGFPLFKVRFYPFLPFF